MAAVNSPLQSTDSAENTLYFYHYFAFLETYCSQMTQDKKSINFFLSKGSSRKSLTTLRNNDLIMYYLQCRIVVYTVTII